LTKEQRDDIRKRLDVASITDYDRDGGPHLRTMLIALLDEVERLTTERDVAYRRGAEAMRVAAMQQLASVRSTNAVAHVLQVPVPKDKP
jgi:hypothetical protein